MTENNEAWQRFFEKTETLHDIDLDGYTYVTAEALKLHGQREPRLMAKIDTLAERPDIFTKHRLALFPTRNGHYILFRDPDDKSYYRFGSEFGDLPIQEYVTNADLFAFDAFPGAQRLNESQAIDFAYISGLLQHFIQDSQIALAIRGRTYSNPFRFYLPNSKHPVEVVSVQIEIDAGYESPTGIYLIEAKVGRRNDFNIRQLYYPYLEWISRSQKRVVPIFLVYTNGKYYLSEFRFAQDFGDLRVVRHECFVINEQPRPPLSLTKVLGELPPTATLHEPVTPYPQANDLDKVLDVVAKVETGVSTKQEIAEAFEFDERQGDYYANAACYLGLLQREEGNFGLTEIGKRFLQTRSRALRNELVVRQLLSYPSYRAIFQMLQHKDFVLERLSNQQIAATIAAHTTLSGSTPGRRAQSVRSWLATLLRNAAFQA
jgi:hypothetical protein